MFGPQEPSLSVLMSGTTCDLQRRNSVYTEIGVVDLFQLSFSPEGFQHAPHNVAVFCFSSLKAFDEQVMRMSLKNR